MKIVPAEEGGGATPPRKPFLVHVGWLLFLLIRGFLLWILLPFALVSWLLIHWWWQRASLGQAACWYDSLLTLFLIFVLLRPLLYRDPQLQAQRFPKIPAIGAIEPYRLFIMLA
ncbi:hypothetical protein [Microbacterium sp. NPDC089696]|uniref:hypothetical protein n=1 Tax=Microbacterium sp. NPDC089696 TaxID=3364199 RepID=UPI00381DDCA8